MLDFWKKQWNSQRTGLDLVRSLSDSRIKNAVKKIVKEELEGFPEEQAQKSAHYAFTVLAYSKKSDIEKAITASFKYGAYALHPTTETDRLGNSDLPFPIAFAFGDRDWIGTEGAEKIVRNNKFFKVGLS